MEKNLKQTIARTLLKKSADSAEKYARSYCRYWIGQEKVPKKLLEKDLNR